jgi:predicted O-methyltransferase YrrM
MHFDKIADVVDGIPHMRRRFGRRLYDHVVEHELADVLELGCYHGVSTCYLAGAVDELGRGHVTTLDRKEALALDPTVHDLLDRCGLAHRVTTVFAHTSFTWELRRMLAEPEPPSFDFVFLDAGHTWDVTGFAFFLVDRLLRPGGWLLFDDLNWSVDASASVRTTNWAKALSAEERSTQQVRDVFDVLVGGDPRYSTTVDGNWGWAQKVGDTGVAPRNPTSTIERGRRWVSGKVAARGAAR